MKKVISTLLMIWVVAFAVAQSVQTPEHETFTGIETGFELPGNGDLPAAAIPQPSQQQPENAGDRFNFPGANYTRIMANTGTLKSGGYLTDGTKQQFFTAYTGWTGLSSYLIPNEMDIEQLLAPFLDKLVILYNFDGTYYPAEQINTLDDWDPFAGYVAKFNQEFSFMFTGEINENRELALEVGWNLIPVLSGCLVDVEILMAGQEVIVVKEVAGYKLYWPAMGINSLGALTPGKAYFVLMGSPGNITFPDCYPQAWECGDLLHDTRDGTFYTTVQIGAQCWMAENLNIGTMINGNQNMTNNGIIEKYCYDNSESNCNIYGGLYQWNEAMAYNDIPGSQGICPVGWFLPTHADWTSLATFLSTQSAYLCNSNTSYIAKALAATTDWNSSNEDCAVGNNPSTNNATNFTALPGAYLSNGSFYDKNNSGNWWASSQLYNLGHSIWLTHSVPFMGMNSNSKLNGLALRCLRDETTSAVLPTVTTEAITGITASIATSGGNVTDDGGAEVSARGVVWSTTNNPTIEINQGITADGEGLGAFASQLTGLTPETTYYVRAYATNVAGTGYGEEFSFATIQLFAPTVTTTEVTEITSTTATSGGNVNDDGNTEVSDRGVVWSTTENPTIENNEGITSDGGGLGEFVSQLTSLAPETTYFVRAYATNVAGIAYGEELSFTTLEVGAFTCGQPFSDPRDGQAYATVLIGGKCWMAENLKYLPVVVGPNTLSQTLAYYYVYGYNGTNVNEAKATANYNTYGTLYNGTAALTSCPDGWNLSGSDDWGQLINFLGGNSVAGGKLKETGTIHWNSPNTGATNEVGFTALPSGFLNTNGVWRDIGSYTKWWQCCYDGTSGAMWAQSIYNHSSWIYQSGNSMQHGFSVRCVKEGTSSVVLPNVSTNAITDISATTATSGGNVNDDGGAAVTARGVVWSTTENPTIEINEGITSNGEGLGEFASQLTGLAPETTYYVRAYATNVSGIAYGEEFSFATGQATIPAVITMEALNITATTATTGGNVTDDGGAYVIARGVVWSTTENPTIETNEGIISDGEGLGEFVSQLNGLTPETTYYVRAYATNVAGTDYGDELNFTTLNCMPPEPNAGDDVTICKGSSYQIVGASGGQGIVQILWTTSGDGTFSDPSALNPIYTPGLSDIVSGAVMLSLSASTGSPCPPLQASDQMHLLIQESPIISAGPDLTVFFGDAIPLTGNGFNFSAVQWFTTNGMGYIEDENQLNASYIPSFMDFLMNYVEFVLFAAPISPCNTGAEDWLNITFNCSAPEVFAGEDAVICQDESYQIEGATIGTSATLIGWTTNGLGTFSDPSALNPVYTPGLYDIAIGHVVLSLSASTNSPCPPLQASDQMHLFLQKFPIISAGGDLTVCFGDTIPLTGNGFNWSAVQWFTSNGLGYIENENQLNASYIPSFMDLSLNYVEFGIIAEPISPCNTFAEDWLNITLVELPTANAGPDQLNLQGTTATLAGNQPPTGGYGQWSIQSGTGGSIAQPNSPTSAFTGLVVGNSYTLRWTVYDQNGCSAQDEVSISFENLNGQPCPGMSTVTDADGNVYNTVLIGNQCWMKQNLKTTKYRNGIDIAYPGSNNTAWTYNTTGAYAWYNNDIAYKNTYGALYNLRAVNNSAGLCPTGWHVPTDAQWIALTTYVSSQPAYLCNSNTNDIAKALAATTNWNTHSGTCTVGNNLSANNATGFTALPGGIRNPGGSFFNENNTGFWWSSTEASIVVAIGRYMSHSKAVVDYGYWDNYYGLSVRCLMDETFPPTYNLILEVYPAGAGIVNGAGQYEAGQQVNITAEAYPGLEFLNWTDDNGIVSEVPDLTYTMLAEDVTLTANFIGEHIGFACGDPLVDPRDGQQYETVQIGNQCWMAENLNIGTRIDFISHQTNNGTIEKYCINNSDAQCNVYGGFYEWNEMMGYTTTAGVQGICPDGWHIPTDTEWTALTTYLGGDSVAGGKMKETGTTHWNSPNIGATNSSGFTALPGGYCAVGWDFYYVGMVGYFWSSTEYSTTRAWNRNLSFVSANVYRNKESIIWDGFSVRCLRD